MLGGDETTCGNQVNQFFSYSNGHGFYNSEFTAGSGFVNTRREVIEAVFPANGHVASNSMLGDNGQALLQHFLAANNYNPSGLMKLWWGGVVIPDEVSSKREKFRAWIVCDQALLLGESGVAREITHEPHANEDAGARDWKKKTVNWPWVIFQPMVIRFVEMAKQLWKTFTDRWKPAFSFASCGFVLACAFSRDSLRPPGMENCSQASAWPVR